MTGKPRQTLITWCHDEPALFQAVIVGCATLNILKGLKN